MIREVRFSRAARADLQAIWDYLHRQSGNAAADAYCDQITDYCEGLSLFPERGRTASLGKTLTRTTSLNRRVSIAYHVTDDAVIVDRIRYAGRER